MAAVILSVSAITTAVSALTCNPQAALARAKWREFGKVKQTIAIEPFVNQAKEKSGAWLSTGLAELLGDYLSSVKNLGILKGIVRQYPPAAITPDYVVRGSYQRDENTLLVHIIVFSQKDAGSPVFNGGFSISPPNTGRIFTEMLKTARGIMNVLKLNYDKGYLADTTLFTSNYMTYDAYINALESMWKFDPNHMDVANIWFRDAKKHDIYFQRPYIAQSEMYAYLALMAKMQSKPYTQYLELVERIDNERVRHRERPSPLESNRPTVVKNRRDPRLISRFLNSNAHFTAGLQASRNGDPKKAAKEFEAAVKYVPEDSAALTELYHMYKQSGDEKKAEMTLNRLYADGICR